MIQFLSFLCRFIITLFKPDISLHMENLLLKKENEILKRKLNLKKMRINKHDKIFFVILNMFNDITKKITLVSPATLLKWQRMLIQNYWTFLKPHTVTGRPPVPNGIKKLILEMKNDNLCWGARRIRDELLKLNIDLHRKTIQNIINAFHKRGKIKKSITWKKFLSSHIETLFAMDYFTVDTIFNQRFYVFFIIAHKCREIVQIAITQNPTTEFVKQQLIEFEHSCKRTVYLIHDRDCSFISINYLNYGIKDIATSIKAPNMNSIAERFVRSIRNEALDNFILFNQKQISKIIYNYIEYYNNMRPHQGINAIPKGVPPDKDKCSHHLVGNVSKKSVLSGLWSLSPVEGHHHYFYKEAA